MSSTHNERNEYNKLEKMQFKQCIDTSKYRIKLISTKYIDAYLNAYDNHLVITHIGDSVMHIDICNLDCTIVKSLAYRELASLALESISGNLNTVVIRTVTDGIYLVNTANDNLAHMPYSPSYNRQDPKIIGECILTGSGIKILGNVVYNSITQAIHKPFVKKSLVADNYLYYLNNYGEFVIVDLSTKLLIHQCIIVNDFCVYNHTIYLSTHSTVISMELL